LHASRISSGPDRFPLLRRGRPFINPPISLSAPRGKNRVSSAGHCLAWRNQIAYERSQGIAPRSLRGEDRTRFFAFRLFGSWPSDGVFEAGTIGLGLEESLTAIRQLTQGPQILAGSSMGGWFALLAARALHKSGETERLKGLVLLAPAVDFTEVLLFEKMPASARTELLENGVWFHTSAHEPSRTPITRQLIEEGDAIHAHAPVHILQGMQDKYVPWTHAMLLAEKITSDRVNLTLIKHGDHRLSREEDLVTLCAVIEGMA
jgi:pimeloyl-ACP methyl ester carboxylesterase